MKLLQQLKRCIRESLGQRRQDTRRGFNENDLEIAFGRDAIETEGDQFTGRVVQLGREFDPSRAGADDRHVQLAGHERRLLRVRAQASIQQPGAETFGLGGRIERDRMLRSARCSKIVGLAPHRNYEGIVGQDPTRQYFGTGLVIQQRREDQRFACAVESFHPAQLKLEMMPARLGKIIQFVVVLIHAASGDPMQQRFPQMSTRAVNQGDAHATLATEPVTKPGGEFKSARAATDDDEAMFPGASCRLCDLTHADVFSRPNLEDSGILQVRAWIYASTQCSAPINPNSLAVANRARYDSRMREKTERQSIERLMQLLGRRALGTGTVYFTGGASAVLLGWREMTLDIDLKLAPEPDGVFAALRDAKEELGINIELAALDDFIPAVPGWQERSLFIAQVGAVEFRHYDFYGQALSKIERGHAQDVRCANQATDAD